MFPQAGYHPTARYRSRDIQSHTAVLEEQIRKSVRDPRMIQLAEAIANGSPSYQLYDNLIWWGSRWAEGGSGASRHLALPGGGSLFGPDGSLIDEQAYILRVFQTVKRNVRYVHDDVVIKEAIRRGLIPPQPKGKPDAFMSASVCFMLGMGDCDDHVTCHLTLLGIARFKVGFDVISTDGQEWQHIFGLVAYPRLRPTVMVPLDTAAPEANSQPYVGWAVPDCGPRGPGSGPRGVCAAKHYQRMLHL